MAIKHFYIQQLSFDGVNYKKGKVTDLLPSFNIGVQDTPFKYFPEIKELPKRSWLDEDGEDVYIPKKVPLKSYSVDIAFLYKGTEKSICADITNFIKFLYGRNENAIGARLSFYDEYTKIGRKDVYVENVSDNIFCCEDTDKDCIAAFKVRFKVCDPATDVQPQYDNKGNITDLIF